MVRLKALQIALMGLVGFRPHYDPRYPQYAPELLESRSGLYVDDIKLIIPENLTAALPLMYVENYPVWEVKAYGRNSLVRVDGVLYMATLDTNPLQAPVNGGPWARFDVLSAQLRYIMDASVSQLINTLVNTKTVQGAKSVLEETRLYHGAGNINSRIVKTGRFVGFEVEVKDVRDMAVRIRSIGLQVDTPNPELSIYIYHSSSSVPLKILKPGFQSSGTFAWAAVSDALLMMDSSTHGPNGAFYIGYYEDDVVGQIVERETPWPDYTLGYWGMTSAHNCGRCNPQNQKALEVWARNLEIHPFTVASSQLNAARTLWNVEQQTYNYNTNYGLNLDLAVECDMTQFIQRNELLLADALHKITQVKTLEVFTTTIQNNPIAEQCKLAAAYNLDNRENYSPGLIKQMNAALAALSLNVADGDSPCVPSTTEKVFGVSHGAV